MATALGQGWFSREAFGKVNKFWYTDKVIDGNAHGLYPLVSEYLKDNRAIDAEFARRACEIFNARFPTAGDTVALTSSILVMADSLPNKQDFLDSLRKSLPHLNSSSLTAPFNAQESTTSFKDDRSERTVVLLSAGDLDKLSCLGISNEQIAKLKGKCADKASASVTLSVGNKAVLFCIASTPSAQQEAFFKVLTVGKWPSPEA